MARFAGRCTAISNMLLVIVCLSASSFVQALTWSCDAHTGGSCGSACTSLADASAQPEHSCDEYGITYNTFSETWQGQCSRAFVILSACFASGSAEDNPCDDGEIYNETTDVCDLLPVPVDSADWLSWDGDGSETCVNYSAVTNVHTISGKAYGQSTGVSCTTNNVIGDTETPTTDGCISSGGHNVCFLDADQLNAGLGSVDGVVPTGTGGIPPSGCGYINGGALQCWQNAPDSARPDDGTPSNPATPDFTITTTSGQTYDVYLQSTIDNSTVVPTGLSGSGDQGSDIQSVAINQIADILEEQFDTTATPEIDSVSTSGFADLVDAAVVAPSVDTSEVSSLMGSLIALLWPVTASNTCPLLAMEYNGMLPVTWPEVCSWLDLMIEILDYVLGVLTLIILAAFVARAGRI